MASAAVLWFGEIMSAVPLRNNKVRGSGRAHRNGAGRHRFDRRQHHGFAARRARPLFCRGADREFQCRSAGQTRQGIRRTIRWNRRPGAAWRTEGRPGRHGHRMRRRRKRHHRGRGTSRRLGDGGRERCGRIEAGIGRSRPRRDGCARQQGMPGLCRRFLHAARGESRRLHPAGGFRTQRIVSGAFLRQPRGTGARDHHRLGRAVPHLGRRPTSSRRRWSRP